MIKEVFMLNQFSRTQLLYGKEAMDKLKNSRVAILGLGGACKKWNWLF
jgi:tRNA A37 threonylcarbamoyladenosine dehydratase